MRTRRIAIGCAPCLLAVWLGCYPMMSGLTAHNSRGQTCVESPAFGAVDIVIAAGTGLGLVATGTGDEIPWLYVIPGVFFVSGLVGVIAAESCRSPRPPTPTSASDVPVYPDAGPVPGPDAASEPEPQTCSADIPCPQGFECVVVGSTMGQCLTAP